MQPYRWIDVDVIDDVYGINLGSCQEDELETGARQMIFDESLVVEKSVPLFRHGSESNKRLRWKMREYVFLQLPRKLHLQSHEVFCFRLVSDKLGEEINCIYPLLAKESNFNDLFFYFLKNY